MRRERVFLCLFLFAALSLTAQTKLAGYVDPFIGTGGHAHTYPGASLPFGLVQLSPDEGITGWDWCSGYHYSDSSIMGFSHTHLSGTGCADYGDILLMPITGGIKLDPGTKDDPDAGYRSRFSHDDETASPGYYSVLLKDYNINVELTVTKRAGFHKYTFPENEAGSIIIDLVHGIEDKTTDAYIEIIDNKTIKGYRRSTGWARDHCVYFYAEFSKPFDSYLVADSGRVHDNVTSAQSEEVKAAVSYDSPGEVLVKVGISHTNLEEAENNVLSEIKDWDFEKVKQQAEDEWENQLSRMTVETDNKDKKVIFYTALYHSLLAPNTMSDADGKHIGMDGKVHSTDGDIYTVFSLWDTFRGEHPLFTIIDPQNANDMVNSLLAKYDESGLLPVWELASNETGTMIGYHSIPVIADAYMKGIRDYDVEKAYEAMKKSAMQDKLGLEFYKKMGFIPADLENEAVSKTLEYAYDDWCIAMVAKDLGKEDDYNYFIERAKFYQNQFDPSTSLMRPKKNGKWFEPFDPFSVSGDYTEANAWQYSFFVPQDVSGLIKLMGGDEKFIAKLDALFSASEKLTGREQPDISGLIGQYAHGNEPSHHIAYLYNYAGAPWKTQKIVRHILDEMYTTKTDGLAGNEDCGQMSAWYVLSAAGFYPVCPGDGEYIIGTPDFDKTVINLEGGKTFTIKAENLSPENFYIQSATLNGKDYSYTFINHSELQSGGELILTMGSRPSEWGSAVKYRPVSSIDKPMVTVPYLVAGDRIFRDSLVVKLAAINTDDVIYYTTDGSDPRESKNVYEKPFTLKNTTVVKYVGFNNGLYSKVVTSSFNNIPADWSVTLNSEYNPKYAGGGALGLVDGIRGSDNFHTPAWQGYEGNDVDAVIDLGSEQDVSSVSANFLQAPRSWIFYPETVEYYISSDGSNYSKVYSTTNELTRSNAVEGIKDFEADLGGKKARYIRVHAKNMGECPPWHLAPGVKPWVFIDEITIK